MMMGEFGSGVHEFYDAGEKVFSCLMVLFVRYLLPEGRDWNMWQNGVQGVGQDAPGPFPSLGGVDVMEGGQAAAKDFLY